MNPRYKFTMDDIRCPYDEILHSKTLKYWNLSKTWNGSGSKTTVGDALNITRQILTDLSPARRLYARTDAMQSSVINYGSKKGMQLKVKSVDVANAQILQFKKA